jgi:hypothetical protein
MPTKKQVKKNTENIIEKELGVRLYQLQGELDCQIAPFTRTSWNGKQYMVGHVAASLFTSTPPSEINRVSHTCGIKNCVSAKCLVVNGHPLTEYHDGETYKAKIDPDAPDSKGYIHGQHPESWKEMPEAQRELARKGEYDVSKHGFLK